MGWRIVKQPNGLLARWSSVVDDFTHVNMAEAEAVAVCRMYPGMGRAEAAEKVRRGVEDEPVSGFLEVGGRGDGLDRWRDCLETIRAIHGPRLAEEREAALSGPPAGA
jgi:hypothetical protein